MPSHIDRIYLRRRQRVIVPEGTGALPLAALATALKNLAGLGYTASPALLARLRTLDERGLVNWYRWTLDALRRQLGADQTWAPMYPGFPAQVLEAAEAELYLNALMHYLGDHLGLRILPDYLKPERPALGQIDALRQLELGSLEDLQALTRDLAAANTSLSAQDKADLVALLTHFAAQDLRQVLPERIPHKENLSVIAAALLDHPVAHDLLLTHYFKTATDVLRLAVARSRGDVSLAAPTRFRAFSRAERRLLLGLLDRIPAADEDVWRHPRRWIRLGERLHPGEHRARFPRAAAVFDRLRSGQRPARLSGKVEAALARRAVPEALAALRARPGELVRRLDHLLRLAEDPAPVLAALAEDAAQVATPVLLQALVHFRHRAAPAPIRAFFPKGNAARVVALDHRLPPLPKALCAAAARLLADHLRARFKALPPLGRVHLDPALADCRVPFSQRSAQRGLRTLVRGSRLPLPAGDTLRAFLWWREAKEGERPTGRVDLDLSVALYDAHWQLMGQVSYTNLREQRFQVAHSGDITSAPDGACEFIDLHLPSMAAHKVRYAVLAGLSFTRQPFSALPECALGWMIRAAPGSGEIFEPATVLDRLDLAAPDRICVPGILDVTARSLIWCDVGLPAAPTAPAPTNLETHQTGIQALGKALTWLVKPSLYDLLALHVEARGARVSDPAQADLVFGLTGDLTPFDQERIMAEFLA